MTLRHRSALRWTASGAATVEFALILPVLIILLVLMVDLGRMAYHYNVLLKAVREAGRYLGTQTPGNGVYDKGLGGGTQTTWQVATSMVTAYADHLCPGAATPCLTADMVKITDAKSTNESATLLANLPFGTGSAQGTQSLVRVRIEGYQMPSLFAGYLGALTPAQLPYPTVSATFTQL